MSRTVELVPDAAPEVVDPAVLGRTSVRDVKKVAAKSQSKEPQMAALTRILGDHVRDIFPEEFREAVTKSYTFWREHPDSYLDTLFDTAQERDDTLTVLRAYAECAPDGPWSIRTQANDNPKMLCWRVQNRFRRNTSSEDSE